MVRKGNLAIFEIAISPKPERPCPPKLVCMHVTTISMVRKGNLAVLESSNISETGEATPTKIGVHVLDINPYLHEFFEPILIN